MKKRFNAVQVKSKLSEIAKQYPDDRLHKMEQSTQAKNIQMKNKKVQGPE